MTTTITQLKVSTRYASTEQRDVARCERKDLRRSLAQTAVVAESCLQCSGATVQHSLSRCRQMIPTVSKRCPAEKRSSPGQEAVEPQETTGAMLIS